MRSKLDEKGTWNNTTRFFIKEYPRVLGPRSTETLYNRCFQLIDFITADIYEVEPPVAGKLRIQRWAILALGFFYSAGSQIRPGRGSVFSLVLPASLFSVIIFMQAKCSYRKFIFSSFFSLFILSMPMMPSSRITILSASKK